MNVAIIWHCRYPWDIRIEKFARTIARQGHRVILITRGSEELKEKEIKDGIIMHRVYFRFPPRFQRLSNIVSLPLFFNPFWFLACARIVYRECVDVAIVRDLPLAFPVGIMGRVLGVRTVFDMAENYPAALIAYDKIQYKFFLFADGWLPRMYERLSLKCVGHTIVVAEEQKERLEKQGVPPSRLTIVRNTPESEFFKEYIGPADKPAGISGRYILYSGFMDRHRGIRTLIQAFHDIHPDFPDVRLVLIGKGNDYDEARRLAGELMIAEKVVFTGWMDCRQIPVWIRHSTVCVIPHLKTEHTDTTIPNKVFDYLYFGKPVAVSDAKPLQRIVLEAKGGLVFRSGDHLSLSKALRSLLTHPWPEERSCNERALIENKYNWNLDGRVLLETIG